MLFINFLCLLYLMVLSNGHTISKSIDNDHKTAVSEAVTSLEHTTLDRTSNKFRQKVRREETTIQHNELNKPTKLLIVPSRGTDKLLLKTTTDHVKYKSQKRKAVGFWRKFKGKDKEKDKKTKHNYDCKFVKNKQRSIPKTRQYGWWKHTERKELADNPKKSNRKNRFAFILRRPDSNIAKRDVKNAEKKNRKTVSNVQIGITPHILSSAFKANKFEPIIKTQTLKKVSNMNENANKNMSSMSKTISDNNNATSTINNLNENVSSTTPFDEFKEYNDMSSMLASITSKISELKKLYKIGKYPCPVAVGRQTTETADFTTPYIDFTGTAQIEELLRNIKVKAMEMVAENSPAVTDLITNAVTETTFEADPLLTHLQLITAGYLLNDNKMYDARTAKDLQNLEDTELDASYNSGRSDPHNIVTRSFKDDTITIAHNVEDMLQRELKYIYKKVKSKVSNEYTKEMKKATKAIKSTTKKVMEHLKNVSCPTKEPKETKCTVSEEQSTAVSTTTPTQCRVTTVSRHSRGTKGTKKEEDVTKPTPATYDDYVMLTLYEQILEKTHQSNVMKMLATADFPVDKRGSDHMVAKRNPEVTTVQYKEDMNKFYEETATAPEYNYMEPSRIEESTDAYSMMTDPDFQRTSFDELSSKISYNDYVNGYKHYLKFQQELADQNFSALVRYQAHRHHNVDDIGKYILDKIPQLPSFNFNPTEVAQVRKKRFFDDSDLDDQDISTKSDDSWFKKHFYFFIDSGPPKKFHTSQTVSIKPPATPATFEVPRYMHGKSPDKVFIQISGDNANTGHSTPDINLAHLTKILEGIKEPTLYTIKSLNDMGGLVGLTNRTEKEIEPHVPVNIVYKIIGNKRRRELTTSKDEKVTDLTNRFKRENASSTDDVATKENEDKSTTESNRHLTTVVTHAKSKTKSKVGYVDINLIPKQTAVVKLRENSTKKNKFKDFFKKFYFKNKKAKKKTKRSNASRLPRFNPFKKIKSIFKAKPYDKGAPNAVRAMTQNISDYDMVITPMDTFKPVKYDKLLSPQDMQKQVPNISDPYYGDLDVSVNSKPVTPPVSKPSYLMKLDDEFLYTTEKPSSTTKRSSGLQPPLTTTPTTTIFAVPPPGNEDPDVISISVKTLATNLMKGTSPTPNLSKPFSLPDLDIAIENMQETLSQNKDWSKSPKEFTKRSGSKRTSLYSTFYTKKMSSPALPIRRPIEDLTVHSKMTRVAKFPITKIKNQHDLVETNNDYISVQDGPMSSDYLQERSAESTERNDGFKDQNAVITSANMGRAGQHKDKATTTEPTDADSDELEGIQKIFQKEQCKKIPNVKVSVQKPDKKSHKYFDYFNDLLMWHNDILNLDKVPVYWTDVVNRQPFTTPNVNNLMNQLKDINLFLEKNPENLKLLPSPRYSTQEYESLGVIRSVGLNDKAVVSTKDFLIEGEAKYFQYNKPPKDFGNIANSPIISTPFRQTLYTVKNKTPHRYANRLSSGLRTPVKGVYRIPIKVNKLLHRHVPTERVSLASFVERSSMTADERRGSWDNDRLLSWEPERSSVWYATKPIGWDADKMSTLDPEGENALRDSVKLSTWAPTVTSWIAETKAFNKDREKALAEERAKFLEAALPADLLEPERSSTLNAEKPFNRAEMRPLNWEEAKSSSWDADQPVTWKLARPPIWKAIRPPIWKAMRPPMWSAGRPPIWETEQPANSEATTSADWDASSATNLDATMPLDENVETAPMWLSSNANTSMPFVSDPSRPVMWVLDASQMHGESIGPWSTEMIMSMLDSERLNVTTEMPSLWNVEGSPFWRSDSPLFWLQMKNASMAAEGSTKSKQRVSPTTDGPIMWTAQGPVGPWTAHGHVTSIFSIADIYYREKLRASGGLSRFGRLPTRTYTRPRFRVKDVRRDNSKESPAVIIDTSLLAYDGEVDTVTKVVDVKKLLRNSEKSTKSSKAENRMASHSTIAPVTKINKLPVQYYTTPLPMKPMAFDKFLKEQGMDVEYVTAPIYDLPSLLQSFENQKQITPITVKESNDLPAIDTLSFKQEKNKKITTKTDAIMDKSHDAEMMKYSKVTHGYNLNQLVSSTKALMTKLSHSNNITTLRGIGKKTKVRQNVFNRYKRLSGLRSNNEVNDNEEYYLDEAPDMYLDYETRIKKSTDIKRTTEPTKSKMITKITKKNSTKVAFKTTKRAFTTPSEYTRDELKFISKANSTTLGMKLPHEFKLTPEFGKDELTYVNPKYNDSKLELKLPEYDKEEIKSSTPKLNKTKIDFKLPPELGQDTMKNFNPEHRDSDIEITIINFDNASKMNKIEAPTETTPILLEDFPNAEQTTFGSDDLTAFTTEKHLHNKLLYKNIQGEIEDFSNVTEGEQAHLFTEPRIMHKPLGILYSLHQQRKFPHRVHISNHHYEYDIYFDSNERNFTQRSSESPEVTSDLPLPTLPMTTASSMLKDLKKTCYTSNVKATVDRENIGEVLQNIMDKNRYAKNAIQRKFNILKLLSFSPTETTSKKTYKPSTATPLKTSSAASSLIKRAEQLDDLDGFAFKFTRTKHKEEARDNKASTISLEDKVYDMAHTIADMLNLKPAKRPQGTASTTSTDATEYDEIINFDAAKAYSKNEESASMLALSEKYDRYLYLDDPNYYENTKAPSSNNNKAKVMPLGNNIKYNFMDFSQPDYNYDNRLDEALFNFTRSDKEYDANRAAKPNKQETPKRLNVTVQEAEDDKAAEDEGFIFISSEDITENPKANHSGSEVVYLKIVDDHDSDVGFFKIVSNRPEFNKNAQTDPNVGIFKILPDISYDTNEVLKLSKENDYKISKVNSKLATTTQNTEISLFKIFDDDRVENAQREQFFKFISYDEYNDAMQHLKAGNSTFLAANNTEEKTAEREDYFSHADDDMNEYNANESREEDQITYDFFDIGQAMTYNSENIHKTTKKGPSKGKSNTKHGNSRPTLLNKPNNMNSKKLQSKPSSDGNMKFGPPEETPKDQKAPCKCNDEGFIKFVTPEEYQKAEKAGKTTCKCNEGFIKFISPEELKKITHYNAQKKLSKPKNPSKLVGPQKSQLEKVLPMDETRYDFRMFLSDDSITSEAFETTTTVKEAFDDDSSYKPVKDDVHWPITIPSQSNPYNAKKWPSLKPPVETLMQEFYPPDLNQQPETENINNLQMVLPKYESTIAPTMFQTPTDQFQMYNSEITPPPTFPPPMAINDEGQSLKLLSSINPWLPTSSTTEPWLPLSSTDIPLKIIHPQPFGRDLGDNIPDMMNLEGIYVERGSEDQVKACILQSSREVQLPIMPCCHKSPKEDCEEMQDCQEPDFLQESDSIYVERGFEDKVNPASHNKSRNNALGNIFILREDTTSAATTTATLTDEQYDTYATYPNNRKKRDTGISSSTKIIKKDLLNRKRAVPAPDTYTAKDVAALEVIVDLMKNTLSYEEKDIASVFSKPMTLDHAMKSLHQPQDTTNSIQVHIAIPYDTQNGKKRSPLEPVRVRKVFSAKMSTPVDLEYQVHSFESDFETTGSLSTVDDGLSPGMYLLVDKPKNGYALKPVKANIDLTDVRARQAGTTPTNTKDTTRREDMRNYTKVTLSKNFIAAVNRQLVELYENLTKVSTRETFLRKKRRDNASTTTTTRKMKSESKIDDKTTAMDDNKQRLRKMIDWKAVKKFFGHDRVCNCKCKANTTMCRACAASDAVMDELIFEFDNLGEYMKEHCTEIQTYFWMNPRGGLKLRNTVDRIDKSLNDYYKRVKGKCQGRPCERLNTYLDKRQFVKTDKVEKEDVATRFLNDLLVIADDVNQTCAMKACFNPKLKQRADIMLSSINSCMSRKHPVKRANGLVTKKKLIKNVYSLDNINVNIICKPDNQVVENYEATTLSNPHSLPTPRSHEHDSLFTFDVDDSHQKYKKRKGFKHLFPRRKKKDRFFTYYTIPDLKSPKVWYKRDTSNQIELPLIADSGGNFWFDYLKAASTNEPRLPKQTFKPISNPKFNIEVVQSKDLQTNKVENKKGTIRPIVNTIYMTVETNTKNSQRDADSNANDQQKETDYFTFTTEDALTHNINQLMELFGSLSDLEKMNMNSNRSTMFLKPTTKQVVKIKPPPEGEATTEELPQLPDISTPFPDSGISSTKATTSTSANLTESTSESSNVSAALIEDLEKKIADLARNGLTMSTIRGTHTTTISTTCDDVTECSNVATSSKTITSAKENITLTSSTTPATKTSTTLSTTTVAPTPKQSTTTTAATQTTTTSKPSTSFVTGESQITKPRTTQTRALQAHTANPCTTLDHTFLGQLKSATLRFLGLRKTPKPCTTKSSKTRRHTLSNANTDQVNADKMGSYLNTIDILGHGTTHDNPTIVIINEYDNHHSNENPTNKNSEDYKNLLLSIIQYETNKLNSEWQKIAYGSERDSEYSFRGKLSPDTSQPTSPPLSAIVPNIKDAGTLQDVTMSAQETTTEKIVLSIPELQLPEPQKVGMSAERQTSKKPSGLLNKIVSKIGMKVASAASKRKEKAVKQSYARDVNGKGNSKQITVATNSFGMTEASDIYPPTSSVCDLQATFDRVKKLRKELVEAKFEEYVKNIPCYKYKRLNRSFFINYRSGGMKWDWIRNKRSLHFGKRLNSHRRFDDGEPNCDVFETFEKGDDDIYRIQTRQKRSARKTIDFEIQWLPPPKPAENEMYVMLGDSTTLDCLPHNSHSRLTEPQPQYSWQTDRKDMLDHDNVQVDGFKLMIWKAGPKNGGRYSCSLDNIIRKVMKVNVVTLPAFDVVFLPTYKIRKECTYEDLRAIQHLGRVMTKQASCGNVCSIRIDEPMCQKDRATNRSLIRTTAVLTMSPRRIKCSVQCRQNLLSSFVRLAADNVPALTKNDVVISMDGVNETLIPCLDVGRPMITHTLRKKDSGGHHEYHKLSSLINPGQMHVVVICHAGYYLMREQRVCAPCPSNTSSTIGDNTCTPCLPGTVSEPGASKCHAIDNRPRRYDWWWYPPCGYMAAFAVVVGACGLCVALSLLMHVLSRSTEVKCDRMSSTSQQRTNFTAQRNPNVAHERYVHTSRARPLSPSRVILARFFRPSLTSSRGTAADSQETRFEQWKERNIPPPLPPIDFDIDNS